MSISGIKLLIIGDPIPLPYEVKVIFDTSAIMGTIAQFQPDVIMTTRFTPGIMNGMTFELRKRWIHVPADTKPEAAMSAVENCYSYNLWTKHQYQDANPLISVYTPTYNTGDYLRETYQSLKDQSYQTWEWVLVDDQSTDGTWEKLEALSKEDIRVRPFRSGKRIEKIGAMKDFATRLCNGEYFVELDHDDFLTDFALIEIKKAFESDPKVGFVYSNSSNFFENGGFHRFGDDYWKVRYRETEYRGKKWDECLQPNGWDRFDDHPLSQNFTFLTVGPNHVRAYRKTFFDELGGYNQNLSVADDLDLFLRAFLGSQPPELPIGDWKCLLLDQFLYAYRFRDNYSNTTFTRNKSIQDHVQLVRQNYFAKIKEMNDRRLRPKGLTSGSRHQPEPLAFLQPSTPGLISIVVPTRGRPASVRRLVESALVTCHDASKIEFCFYADDDDRETIAVLEEMKLRHKVGPRIPLSHAFNEAARMSSGEIIHCCADDIVYRTPGWDSIIKKEFDKIPDRIALVFGRDGHEDGKIPTHPFFHRKWVETIGYLMPPYFSGWYSDNWLEDLAVRIGRKIYVPDVFTEHLHFSVGKSPKDATYLESAARSSRETNVMKDLEKERIFDAAKLKRAIDRAGVSLSDVSFIVLEAAETPLTKRCIESIRTHAPGSEIVYVSNGVMACPDRHADQTVEFDVNLGFAAGCNAGAKVAKGSVLCFFNNDAAFVDDTPAKLLRAMESYEIVAPYSNRAKPPQGDIPREKTPPVTQVVDMVVGLCLMVRKNVFEHLGGFDPGLLTYEDDEFCRKAAKLGFKSCIVASTWVDHERHETFKKLNLDVDKIMAENALIYRKKNPVIRVIVIAKDEEKALPGFFAQFIGVTREWCVLDTGSKDKTLEVARSLGCRVESGPIEGFAAARNEAVRRFGTGADWIIMIDPDERLDSHTITHLRELLYRTPDDILYSPLQAKYPDGNIRLFVSKPFIFRNKPEIKWVFKVHEKLIGSLKQALVINSMNTHLIELHEDGRRQAASGFYDGLMKAEPYFTDPTYKKQMVKDWPILDYDRRGDPRIRPIYAGPLISVVIPTYKRPELLNRAIASALAQDYANLEVIVVGDHCPDLAELVGLGAPAERVRIFNLRQNHGAGGAVPRNHAIAAAGGSLIAYLDDDNVWKPDHVSSLYTAMLVSGASYAFSSMEVNGTDLKFSEPKQGGIDTSCILHQKALVAKYGKWKDRSEANYYHDWEFVSRWVNGGEKWVATKKPTLIYNAETCGQREFLEALAKASK